MNYALTKKVEV